MALTECAECNAEISDKASNCPHCGVPLDMHIAAQPASEGERTFFNERGVRVTNSLFTLPGHKSFAMSGVTAVRMLKVPPKRLFPLLVLIVCTLATLGGAVGFLAGAIAALVWLILQKPMYVVVLSTASGETQALEDRSGEWIARIVAALNQCIVFRG
jgi:hypothetical protein